jgi:hypothetical protein
MRREFERVTCPACHRTVSAYVPHRADGSDVRIVKHILPKGSRARSVECPASDELLGEIQGWDAMTTPEADRLSQIKARLEKVVADEAATEEPDRCASFDELRDALSLVEQLQQELGMAMKSNDAFAESNQLAVKLVVQERDTSARLRTALEEAISVMRGCGWNAIADQWEAALGEPDGRRVPNADGKD